MNATASPRRVDGHGQALFAGGMLVAIAAWVFALRPPLTDDAYLTLNFARTLATSGTWGLFPGHPANTATSPPNVAVLSGLGSAVGSFPLGAHVLAALCFWAVWACGDAVGRKLFGSRVLGFVLLAGVAANPLLLSSIGLEGPLVAALLAAVVWSALDGRAGRCGAFLGLLVLTRMDTALLAILWVAASRRLGLAPGRVALACLGVTAPWFAFAWIVLGSAVPDTLFLKASQVWGDGLGFLAGPKLYLAAFPAAFGASFLFVAAAPFAFRGAPEVRRVAAVLVGYAAAAFGVYALVLDPPPYPWYFLQQAVPLAVVGAFGLAVLAARDPKWAWAGALPLLVAMGLVLADPTRGAEPFVHANWAGEARYREIGEEIARTVPEGEAIAARTEPGTIAFHSGRLLADEFSDRVRADLTVRFATSRLPGPLASFVRMNYAWRAAGDAPIVAAWDLSRTAPDAEVPPGALTWQVASRWMGPSRIVLRRTAE